MKKFDGLIVFFLLLTVVLPQAGIAQKAYVTTKYQGTVNKLTVIFNLANGYVPGNEIKLFNKTSRKTIRFLPENHAVDETRPTKFYHYSPLGKKFTDYFFVDSLKENFETMPSNIIALYYNKARPVRFILNKK